MADTADNYRVAVNAIKNQVMVRSGNLCEYVRIVRYGADARANREPRYRVFDRCGHRCGCNKVIPRDMLKNLVRFDPSRRGVADSHAP
jgi:hypothetical protein